MQYLIKNVRIVNPDENFVGDVLLGNGVILEVADCISVFSSECEIIDGTKKILMPGLIDPHVHFRDPGLTQKEDFVSGSRAAVSGGITTVFDMPNTIPPVFDNTCLEQKKKIIRPKSLVHWGIFICGGDDNFQEIKEAHNVPGVKLYLNATTGNLKNSQESMWRKLFRTGKKIALHAEGEVFEHIVNVWQDEGTPCELHLCHASLASEVESVRKRKSKSLPITAEVCPHHLLLSQSDDIPLATMKPELRSKSDTMALWEGIEDGTIDILATDHAPHLLEEKETPIPAFGIPGVETLFPLLFSEFQKRKFCLQQFVQMTSFRTRSIFHIRNKKGIIQKGWDGDVILINPETEWHIDASSFFSKAQWSPFDRWAVKGKIEKTFIDGDIVFEDGKGILSDKPRSEIDFEVLSP
jgi:dihydroorotase